LIFLSIALVPIIFGDYVIQTRMLYNIPFEIPVAIALTSLVRKNGMIAVAICIWLLAIAVRTVSNFHLVLPT
jgi:hypothetical protein